MDLSSPKSGSVNDGVNPVLRSMCVRRLGRGARLEKFDIVNAEPVHPVNRFLLGMRWRGATLVNGALPFGLRSAPKLLI